ncbi:hypothetical protein GNF10_32530 [Nostoc sp. UCD121]|uniref:hypothetical protein n=1 Tax=unclassified Nostoc TaxID=2593658 RepID=UPI00162322F5|nr:MULTISPECIES: hypothetical protein [unclassified Nostoc]MBC1225406.1 hypothetical protein [Nostoc sp. UCD120]MBC1280541.1 hypothetical protein [Nostoc sp. UCD121]
MVDKNTRQKLKRVWCERLAIFMCMPILLGVSVIKMQPIHNYLTQLDTYKQRLDIELYQDYEAVPIQEYEKVSKERYVHSIRKLEHEKVVSKEGFVLVRKLEYESGLGEVSGGYRVLEFKLIKQQQYEQISKLQNGRKQVHGKYLFELFVLLVLASGFVGMLVLLLRQRNQISLPLTDQLIIVLPEEYIADLEALYQYKNSQDLPVWVIKKEMLWTVLGMLWAFHIQINLDNLWLPNSKGHKRIDD